MNIKWTNVLLLLIAINSGCEPIQPEKPVQSVLLFRDRDGVYEYSFATAKEKLIFKLEKPEVFLDEPAQKNGNILTFGVTEEFTGYDEYDGLRHSDVYIAVDLNTGNWSISRKVNYHVEMNDKYLDIEIAEMNSDLWEKTITNSRVPYCGEVWRYRGIWFNDSKGRFYSEHVVGDKKIYCSDGGSLYFNSINKGKAKTELLVSNDYFDPKFGSGYLQPQLDPSGKYAICTYQPGFLKGTPALVKIGLSDKKIKVLKEGQFAGPQFSADGKFVLFRRNAEPIKGSNPQLDTWESEIYILNLNTLEETKIGNAGLAQWAPL